MVEKEFIAEPQKAINRLRELLRKFEADMGNRANTISFVSEKTESHEFYRVHISIFKPLRRD